MAIRPLKDLSPRHDVKGGSPRTPIPPVSIQEYQAYSAPVHGNGVWKTLAGAAGGLWIMSMLAWWTAMQGRGVTRTELRDEMKEYKDSIARDVSVINTQVGELKGKQEKIQSDLNHVQFQQATDERDFIEFKTETKSKMGTVADYLESQKTKK